MLAALVGLWQFYGFEACGDVAEEVKDPERRIPVAMILTIVIGLVAAFVAYAGFVLAAPNLQEIVNGDIADPIPAIVRGSTGEVGMKFLLVVAATIFLSAALSQQAALSRLLYSFARDNMLPGSKWLSKLHQEVAGSGAVPRNAMIAACSAPMVITVWLYFKPDSVVQVTAFAVLGIYVCFQMVVLAALRQRIKAGAGGTMDTGTGGMAGQRPGSCLRSLRDGPARVARRSEPRFHRQVDRPHRPCRGVGGRRSVHGVRPAVRQLRCTGERRNRNGHAHQAAAELMA